MTDEELVDWNEIVLDQENENNARLKYIEQMIEEDERMLRRVQEMKYQDWGNELVDDEAKWR